MQHDSFLTKHWGPPVKAPKGCRYPNLKEPHPPRLDLQLPHCFFHLRKISQPVFHHSNIGAYVLPKLTIKICDNKGKPERCRLNSLFTCKIHKQHSVGKKSTKESPGYKIQSLVTQLLHQNINNTHFQDLQIMI